MWPRSYPYVLRCSCSVEMQLYRSCATAHLAEHTYSRVEIVAHPYRPKGHNFQPSAGRCHKSYGAWASCCVWSGMFLGLPPYQPGRTCADVCFRKTVFRYMFNLHILKKGMHPCPQFYGLSFVFEKRNELLYTDVVSIFARSQRYGLLFLVVLTL